MSRSKGSTLKSRGPSGRMVSNQSKRLRMTRRDKRQMAGLLVIVVATAFIGMWTALIKIEASTSGVLAALSGESFAMSLPNNKSSVEMSYSTDTEFRDESHKINPSEIPIGASITVTFARSLFTLDHAQQVLWHNDNASGTQVKHL